MIFFKAWLAQHCFVKRTALHVVNYLTVLGPIYKKYFVWAKIVRYIGPQANYWFEYFSQTWAIPSLKEYHLSTRYLSFGISRMVHSYFENVQLIFRSVSPTLGELFKFKTDSWKVTKESDPTKPVDCTKTLAHSLSGVTFFFLQFIEKSNISSKRFMRLTTILSVGNEFILDCIHCSIVSLWTSSEMDVDSIGMKSW